MRMRMKMRITNKKQMKKQQRTHLDQVYEFENQLEYQLEQHQ